MKKKLLLGFISLFCLSAFAEEPDIIMTKLLNPTKIVAKVDTITHSEVIYTLWGDSQEKEQRINLAVTKGIAYGDGQTVYFQSTLEEIRANEDSIIQTAIDTTKNGFEDKMLAQIGKNYYLGRNRISKEGCINLMKENCPLAYQQFSNANRKAKDSWRTFGVGLGFDFIGGFLLGFATQCSNPDAATICGALFVTAGGVMTFVSLPIACVQTARRCDALNTYNTAILAKKVAELKFNANSDGSVGIALEF